MRYQTVVLGVCCAGELPRVGARASLMAHNRVELLESKAMCWL